MEQCSDLEVLAKSLHVAFSVVETQEGFRVFLGDHKRGFDRYSDGVIYLTPIHPSKFAVEPYQYCLKDLEKAACFLELGLWKEAWESIEALPTRRASDDDVWSLQKTILERQGRWGDLYRKALELASRNPAQPVCVSDPEWGSNQRELDQPFR